ncbi:MAG TPA: hypothetical protein VNA20_17595 [Frankiaceae bacterium]|nr:hypothetical protein [Frankiaceae bacterium]
MTPPARTHLNATGVLPRRSSAEGGGCPACGDVLPASPVDVGSLGDGSYCSLECLARTLYVTDDSSGEGV